MTNREIPMKITKTKLKSIIKEEYQKILQEASPGYYDYQDELEYDADGYLQIFKNRTPDGITSLAGIDRYADHRSTYDVMREAAKADREVRGFFESAAENAESLLENLDDELMQLEETFLEKYPDAFLSEWEPMYKEKEKELIETYQENWSNNYEEFSSYVNVFSVPKFYYEIVFDHMLDDGLSAREFSRKLYGY